MLIVGAGPAGMLLAAQLSQYPAISTRLIERRPGRLEIGQADGIQARSVETFQAFGFAERIVAEAFHLTSMNFWGPDPANPSEIVRTQRTDDDPDGVSEFPHLIINQARVLDYFAEAAAYGPGRIVPDFGCEFTGLEVADSGAYPVRVIVRRTSGEERTVLAKYVVGCDGARSAVRTAMGIPLAGQQAMHAWAVLDALAVTDFPDIRTKCAIQSEHGSILHIPREGGYLFRMYIDLGEVGAEDNGAVRSTTVGGGHREGQPDPVPVHPGCARRPAVHASTRSGTGSPASSTTCRPGRPGSARPGSSSPATPATRTARKPARA